MRTSSSCAAKIRNGAHKIPGSGPGIELEDALPSSIQSESEYGIYVPYLIVAVSTVFPPTAVFAFLGQA
jgi:hypothetical protein